MRIGGAKAVALAGLLLLLLLLLLAGAARAQGAAPCTVVYGHGRNHDASQPQQNRFWDGLNAEFHAAVLRAWQAPERPVRPLLLPVAATDLGRNLAQLMALASERGCSRVLETALFADYESGSLVARLRLYPLHGSLGPLAAPGRLSVGAPLLTQQREFELTPRSLERLRPEALGAELAAQALQDLAP